MTDSLASLFASAVRDHGDRTFLRWCRGAERVRWSYAEGGRRIAATARELDRHGIGRGGHAVVYTAEMVPSIVLDLACAVRGIVFTPIETSSLPSVRELCARVGARAVLTTADRAGLFGDLPVITPTLDDGDATLEPTDIGGDAVYMLQPTSGTTGGSKLVIRAHDAFVRMARLHAFGHTRADAPARVLMVPALTHGMGQYQLAVGVALAAELCVPTRIDVHADIAEVRELDPTHLALTPRVIRSFVQQLGGSTAAPIFGPGARFLLSGGAAADPELLAAIARHGVGVIEAYGASEISVVAMTRPGHWQPGVVGPVLDDVELRVGTDGELEARTPVMMKGYFGAPELTAAVFTADGFYRTGDRVALDDGVLRYLGRVVDTFNLFDGSHVAPGPLEEAISRLPWVAQVLLVGDQRPYVTGLIVPHPAVRPTELGPLAARDLGRLCSGLEVNARIRRVALLAAPFSDEVYKIVGHGKVRRDRAAALARHAELVNALYGDPSPAVLDVPGAALERRASSRQRASWLVRVERSLGYTRDVSRGGAFVELASPPPIATTAAVIDADGTELVLPCEIVRRDPDGIAVRWLGPLDALERRLPP